MKRIVFIGHVDSGKSTLLGHFCLQLGVFTQDEYRVAERKAQENKMLSWRYAYLLDIDEVEQQSGKTHDWTLIETSLGTFIDTPGHHGMISKMIEGSTGCDVAVWILSMQPNEFEKCITDTDHLALVKCLGAKELVVVMNKYDLLKQDIDELETKVKSVVKKFGFKSPVFCRLSALNGYNLTTQFPDYTSSCLKDILENITVENKEEKVYTSNKLVLKGIVISPVILTAGFQCVLFGGGQHLDVELDTCSVVGKPKARFAKQDDTVLITITLPQQLNFTSKRFILRDQTRTLFLGILCE